MVFTKEVYNMATEVEVRESYSYLMAKTPTDVKDDSASINTYLISKDYSLVKKTDTMMLFESEFEDKERRRHYQTIKIEKLASVTPVDSKGCSIIRTDVVMI